MKQALYTAIAMVIAFAAFAGVASAQTYYPGYQQLSWRPPVYYQNYYPPASNGYGFTYGQFTPATPIVQPAGICITCGGYGAWGGINSGTGFGTWAGQYTYPTGNSYYVPANGYYPNGYSYTIRNRNVWTDGDDRFVRNRVRTETFIPF